MYCPNCGKRVKEGEKFCGSCGTPMPEEMPADKKMPVKKLPLILIGVITICTFLAGAMMEDMGDATLPASIVIGCLPALALILYIYRIDRIEPEPVGLIVRLAVFGALVAFPVILVELLLDSALLAVIPDATSLLYLIPENFLAVALVEEIGKYLVVRKLTWKHPAFGFRFDGVVYSAMAALGFAALENVMYILMYGYATGLSRAVTSIPGHCMYGIYIGYYYGQAKTAELDGDTKKSRKLIRFGLMVSILLHGVYDLACSMSSVGSTLFLMVFIVVVNIVAFVNVRRFAGNDRAV